MPSIIAKGYHFLYFYTSHCMPKEAALKEAEGRTKVRKSSSTRKAKRRKKGAGKMPVPSRRGHPRMPYRDMTLGATKVGAFNV